jgi:hypothetical protein
MDFEISLSFWDQNVLKKGYYSLCRIRKLYINICTLILKVKHSVAEHIPINPQDIYSKLKCATIIKNYLFVSITDRFTRVYAH